MNKIKKMIKNNKTNLLIIVISILAIIIGTFAIGFVKSLIIIGIIDLILLVFPIFFKKKGKKSSTKKSDKNEKKKKSGKVLKILLLIFLIGILFVITLCILFGFYIVKKAPEFNPDNLATKESTIVYDKDGEIIAKLGLEKREKVEYEDLPQVLIDAIVATEDSRFFQHNGFDIARFAKASLSQLAGNGGGGASTITMQVSKNAYTSTESSGWDGIVRKFTDIYLSIFKIEKNYSKEDILEFYINSYFMGAGAYGVEQASLTYFDKPVSEINLAEAAMLAGMFQAPGAYNPYQNPNATEARRQQVLYLMERHGYITTEEKEIADKLTVQDIVKHTTSASSNYQGFIDTAVSEVQALTGKNPYNTPMLIYTTMDRKKQDYLNDILSGKTYNWENDVVQAGIVLLDNSNGNIVAVGAGRNKTGANTFNYATMIKKQIGSTAKPLYDYGPAIEYMNWSTYTALADEPHNYTGGGGVSNWDRSYSGLMTMRDALKYSRNIPALKTFQANNKNNILTFVQNLGLHPDMSTGVLYESHSIGGYNGESPLSMAAAYSAFANGGYYNETHSVSKIVYRETAEEYVVKNVSTKVMSEETAYMVSNMLVSASGYITGRTSINGISYGTKTGTTNFDANTFKIYNLKSGAVNDLWVAGFSRDYTLALWYGYDKINNKYTNRTSSGQNTRLYKALIKGLYSGAKNFTKPSGVVEIVVEKETNPAMLPSEYTPDNMKTKELFKRGTEPTEVSNRYAKLSSITNLKSETTATNVVLSWTPITIPDAINQTYLENFTSKLFSDSNYAKKYVNSRLSYNSANIGTLTYNIYSKSSDGTLTYITTTPNSSITLKLPLTSTTYVVKASYTIFTANMSDGVETSVIIIPPVINPIIPNNDTQNTTE